MPTHSITELDNGLKVVTPEPLEAGGQLMNDNSRTTDQFIGDTLVALEGKADASHTHIIADVPGLQSTLDGKAGAATVNAHISNTSNPHSVTAAQVGAYTIGQTDELLNLYLTTVDASSTYAPISHGHTIPQVSGLLTALGTLAPKASPALTGTPTAPTAAGGTATSQLATTGFVAGELNSLSSVYLPLDGSQQMAGTLTMGFNDITNVGTLTAYNLNTGTLTVGSAYVTSLSLDGGPAIYADGSNLFVDPDGGGTFIYGDGGLNVRNSIQTGDNVSNSQGSVSFNDAANGLNATIYATDGGLAFNYNGGPGEFAFDGSVYADNLSGATINASSSGNVGPYHVNATGRFGVSGPSGEFSFISRNVGAWVETPASGERWVLYSDEYKWKIWAGADKLTLDNSGTLTAIGSGIFAGVSVGSTPTATEPLRIYQSGSSASTWKGRGVFGGAVSGVVFGEYNSKAYMGGHNTALNAWTDLCINVSPTAGNVCIGTDVAAGKVTSMRSNDVAFAALSGSAGAYTAYSLGRTSAEFFIGVANNTNAWAEGTGVGDIVLRTQGSNLWFETNGGNGTPSMYIGGSNGEVVISTALNMNSTSIEAINSANFTNGLGGTASISVNGDGYLTFGQAIQMQHNPIEQVGSLGFGNVPIVIAFDDSTDVLHILTSTKFFGSNLYLNEGSGSGGGSLYMDGGSIQDVSSINGAEVSIAGFATFNGSSGLTVDGTTTANLFSGAISVPTSAPDLLAQPLNSIVFFRSGDSLQCRWKNADGSTTATITTMG